MFSNKSITEKEDKKHAELVDNIDTLVDDVLAKGKRSFSDAKVEKKRPSDEFFRSGINKNSIIIVKNRLPVRKILAVVLTFILIFVLIPASLPYLYGGFDSDVAISLYPENVHDGDSMFVNATIPSFYNILSVAADIGGIETLDLSLIDNSTNQQLWQVVWLAHDVEVGEHTVKISALDQDNKSYTAEVRWSVLAKETSDFNETSEPLSNETRNVTSNETEVLEPLNISISADKESYFVNDTVNIQGAVKYNETLVSTPVNITIKYSNETISSKLDATNGSFYYQFIPIVDGYYTVNSSVIYGNDTAYSELNILVLEKPDIPTNETEIPSEEKPGEYNDTEIVSDFISSESKKKGYGKISSVKMDYDKAWKYLLKQTGWSLQAFVNGSWQGVDGLKVKYKNVADHLKKFSLDFTATINPKADYRLVLTVDMPVVDYSSDDGNHTFYLKYESSGHLWTFVYDYSDIASLPNLVFDQGITDSRFWFSVQVGDVSVGNDISLDPTYGLIADSVVDSWEWNEQTGYVKNPFALLRLGTSEYYVTSAAGVTESDGNGLLRIFKVWNDNGSIQKTLVDSWQYDTNGGSAGIWHISGDVYAVVYIDSSPTINKIITTEIWSNNGTLKKNTIDTFNLAYWGRGYPTLVHVSGNVYAIVYQEFTGGYDHQLETIWINDTGTINSSQLDLVEFDSTSTTSADGLCAVRIDSDTIAVTWLESDTDDSWLCTYNISSSGDITNTPADSWEFDTGTYFHANYCFIYHIAGNVFAISYSDGAQDGWVKTVSISNDGDITPSWIDTLEYANDNTVYYISMFTIANATSDSPGIYGITCTANSFDGVIYTVNISSDGTIGETIIDEMTFDLTSSWWSPCVYVNGNYYFIVYTGSNIHGWSCTVSIETNYAAPTFSNPSPSNGSVDVNLQPQCNITINDTNGDTMDIYWYENSTGSWVLRQTNSSCSNGTYRWTFSQASTKGQTYYWKVYCNDGVNNVSALYSFTTDGTPPISSVNSISPYWKNTSPATITTTASDEGTGVKNATLYYRYSTNNASWGGNVSAGVDSASPWSWSFSFSNGTGYYEFYSIGIDNATNTESAPGSADASCGYDNQNPKSSVIDGNISDAVLSTFEWQTSYGFQPNVIRVNNSEYYLIIASAGDYDGWAYTIRVWDDNGTIQQSVVSSYCFDSNGNSMFAVTEVNVVHISGTDKYAILYSGSTGAMSIITIQVWDTNGTIKNQKIDTLTVAAINGVFPSQLINVNENIYTWSRTYVGGWPFNDYIESCWIDSNGQIGNSKNDSVEIAAEANYYPRIELVDSDTVALVYTDVASYDGFLKTYNISSTGDITNAATDTWEFDGSQGYSPDIKHISGNTFAIAYNDSSGDGQIKTLTIADTGMITKSWIDTLEFDTDSCAWPYIYPIYDAKLYAVAYQGPGGDGFIKTMNISADGTIDAVIDTLEFDTSDCIHRPSIVYVNKSYYLIVYEGTDNDGWSCTVSINLNGIPYLKSSSPLIISGDGSDIGSSGLKNVTLYYRYSNDNSSWGGWTPFGVDTTPWSDIIWNFNFPNGTGYYQFYSIAADNASNTESVPGSADAICAYDGTAPSSSVNAISPYVNITGSVELTATASDALSGVKNVTLWYRYSSDNSSWDAWMQNITDTDYNWNWTFTFPNGSGCYEFYSIATDNATNTESAPGSADAICRYVTVPVVVTNESTGIEETNATLHGYLSNDGGEDCTAGFEYGLTTSYGTNVTPLPTYIHAAGYTTNKIYQYWQSNMTKKAESSDYGGWIYCLTEDTDYVYAGGFTTQKVFQYWKSNMTKKAESAGYGATIYALTNDDTYVYAAGATTNKVYQYWKSNMTKKTESSDYGGNIFALTNDDTYVYVGGYMGRVAQYWKTNLTKKTWSIYLDNLRSLAEDDTYVYAGSWVDTDSIYQLWKTNITKKTQVVYGDPVLALTNDDTYLYAAGNMNKVYQYWKSNMTKKAETASYGGSILALAQDDTYVYAAGATTNKVYQYWKSNMTKKAETASYGGSIGAVSSSPPTYTTGNTFSFDATGLEPGWLYHYRAVANNSIGTSYGSDMTFLTKPEASAGLTAQTNSSNKIYLTWTKGTGANTTYIERNATGQTVWARGSGTMIYNSTGTNHEDTGLNEGVTYYYQAWSYTTWSTLHQWSDGNASASNTTNHIPTIADPAPANGSTVTSLTPWTNVTINDLDGDTMNITWWSNSSGSWVQYGSNNSCSNETYGQQNSNFSDYIKTYWWNVTVSDGKETNTSWYYFTIEPSVVYVDDNANAGWYDGAHVKTIVEARDNLTTSEKGTIYIWDGSYTETVEFTSNSYPIDIIGNGTSKVFWDGDGGDEALGIYTSAKWISVSKINFSGAVDCVEFLGASVNNCTLSDCYFDSAGCACGIYIWSSKYLTIKNNTFVGDGTDYGISIGSTANHLLIYNNYFSNYATTARDASSGTTYNRWNITKTLGTNIVGGPYLGGNYYSDNTENYDEDGFSEPYTIFGTAGSIDYLPLMEPDNTKPSSNVTAITPYLYNESNNPLTISCTDANDTGGSGLKNVTLYYYNSTDNSSWSGPWSFGVDTDPWIACSWSFTFDNGSGYYRFYSVAADNDSNVEDAPETNDTLCGYDDQNPSSSVNPISPYINTTGSVELTATASDALSGVKNVTLWYRYSSDNSSWGASNWSYSKPITITNPVSGYQMFVNVSYDSDMQSDFDDIRFFDDDNITELSYWLEYKVDGAYAYFWVKLNDAGNLIYMHYGNSTVSSASNGTNTWDYFLDWSTNHSADFTYLDLAATLGNSIEYDDLGGASFNTTAGFRLMHYTKLSVLTTLNQWDTGVLLGLLEDTGEVFSTSSSSNHVASFLDLDTDYSPADYSHILTNAKAGTGSSGSYTSYTPSVGNWHTWEVLYNSTKGAQIVHLGSSEGTEKAWSNVTTNIPTVTLDVLGYGSYYAQYGTGYNYWSYIPADEAIQWGAYMSPRCNFKMKNKWVAIGKYQSTEPSGTFGDELIQDMNYMIWDDTSNPDTAYPWNWSFDFPNGTGYYEFYSIATDNVSNTESAPGSADAICRYYTNTSFTVSPDLWNVGSAWIEGFNTTTDYYFNLTNNGNVALSLTIKASNATNSTTGFAWNLTSTPGYNNFTLSYNKSGVGVWKNINLTYDAFIENLAQGGYQTFDLKILMATLSSKQDLSMHLQVTFKSVIA